VAHLQLIALVVRDYDEAIRFFVDVLQFELVENTPSLTNDGRPKRWVVGHQFGGRVGLFLRVDDFDVAYRRLSAAGVSFVSAPRDEAYGRLAVFLDLEGNKWDLLGPVVDSPPRSPYEVREVTVVARPVAGVRAQVARGQVAQTFGPHLEHVYAAGRSGAVALDGQNIFIYRAATAEELTVEFCVGVTAPFAAVGVVLPLETPHGVAAMTTHRGDYGRLSEANAAIVEWCRANNRLRAGPSWEVYGHWHPDVSQLRTDVYYLLRPTGAAARPQGAGATDVRNAPSGQSTGAGASTAHDALALHPRSGVKEGPRVLPSGFERHTKELP
jgi:catechol 2,3-dioxygenase-like lactoylglutathione lyase family enzyme